ncbi:uncharacterized protein CYBJADRAFT_175390 [Cyberlindnera jadinii NRRL Y-1542]|uniref:Uncharacterized protein n=1 Tax=Cyberlindnera jadinii (strain ATCC 18201 / CBS 1600 / BCRC 20928 / JCM 3617 / NBRC 0987 / NRRL Y-1542) TaxID=983966 RepID=A0A1E4RUZ1_CYBJN|nr:hypothetical protein CYBJADRAFT_175390 [Cyberlindnera jadinii NRRL Y-1542]ODV71093.1 hypothetical protein CYBJADRAFT_175390 [Cyberlindnera jadinii NRRL Y-1542]
MNLVFADWTVSDSVIWITKGSGIGTENNNKEKSFTTESVTILDFNNESSNELPEDKSEETPGESSEEPITASSSEPITDSTESSSESESETPTEPVISGEYDAEAETAAWSIELPGNLGPWESVDVTITKDVDDSGEFDFVSAIAYINGELYSSAEITLTTDSITLLISEAIGVDDILSIDFVADTSSGYQWTSLAHILMTVPDERLMKRAVVEWDLSSTVVNEAAVPSSSKSEPASESRSES